MVKGTTSILSLLLWAGSSSTSFTTAFCPSMISTRRGAQIHYLQDLAPVSQNYHRLEGSSTKLNLFGSKKKKSKDDNDGSGGSGAKVPPAMEQMAMMKMAQEIAAKKRVIDKELQATTFEGMDENEKVKAFVKYSPSYNPMDPNPIYEPSSIIFKDDAWFEGVAPEELSQCVKDAILNGLTQAHEVTTLRFQELEAEMLAAMSPPQS